jgi:hypothetical protein
VGTVVNESVAPARMFVRTVVLGPVVSVAVAFALSLAVNRLYLPLLGGLGDEGLGLVFLLLPVAATIGLGVREQRSGLALFTGGALTVIATQVLSYLVWIGWIFVVCGLQDNRCFD